MKKIILPVLFVALLTACGDNTSDKKSRSDKKSENVANSFSAADSEFLNNVASDGMMELEAAKIAIKKGSDKVKAFAQEMVEDHTVTGNELRALAVAKKTTLPANLSSAHQENIRKLEEADRKSFDSLYAKMMVQSHEQAVALFKTGSTECNDSSVKAFASTKLMILEQHLEHARNLEEEVKK